MTQTAPVLYILYWPFNSLLLVPWKIWDLEKAKYLLHPVQISWLQNITSKNTTLPHAYCRKIRVPNYNQALILIVDPFCCMKEISSIIFFHSCVIPLLFFSTSTFHSSPIRRDGFINSFFTEKMETIRQELCIYHFAPKHVPSVAISRLIPNTLLSHGLGERKFHFQVPFLCSKTLFLLVFFLSCVYHLPLIMAFSF